MKFLSVVLLLLFALASFGAKITDDVLKLGQPGSVLDKDINLGSTRVIRSNETSGKLEFTNDGAIFKNLGSGAGGGVGLINNLDNEGFEDGIAVNWTCTATKCTEETTTPLIGEKSIVFTPTAQNNEFVSDLKAIGVSLMGRACEARFLYLGGDENLTAQVINGDSEVLASQVLIAHTIAANESVFFLCPNQAEITIDSDKGDLQLKIINEAATPAAAATFDDMCLGNNTGLATEINNNEKQYSESGGDFTITGTNWTTARAVGIYYKRGAVERLRFNIQGGVSPGVTSIQLTFSGVTFKTGYDQACAIENSWADGTRSRTNGGTSQITAAGNTASTTFRVSCDVELNSKPTWADDVNEVLQVYKSIPKVSENTNVWSATVAADGTVSNENVEWISSNCTNASPRVCSFTNSTNGVLNCSTDLEAVTASTTTSISIAGNSNITKVICQKVILDFKMPTVQPVLVNQVDTKVEKGKRIESCSISHSGTPTIVTTDCNSWIDSLGDNGLGDVTFNITASVFSEKPTCSPSIIGSTADRGVSLSTVSWSVTEARTITIVSSTGAAVDEGVSIECTGAR